MARSHSGEKRLVPSICLSVRPSLCLAIYPSVCSHVAARLPLTHFRKIWCCRLLWKFDVIWFKSGKYIGKFIWGPTYVLLLPVTFNHLITSSRPSVCRSVRMHQCGFHWNAFLWIFILGTVMTIYWENPHLVKIGQMYWALYVKT